MIYGRIGACHQLWVAGAALGAGAARTALGDHNPAFYAEGRLRVVAHTDVFRREAVLQAADVASFVVLPVTGEGATAQDKHGKFNYEKRVQQ
ncbi:MAG: hypothetical protein ABJB74_06395 [Gemmatimonas sp.]